MAKKYTVSELKAMDDKANIAVGAMTASGVAIGFAPVLLDIALFMAAMGTGVVGIGACYDMKLNKDDAGILIKQFFTAAGLTFSFMFTAQKLGTSALKSNPVSYVPAMVVDAATCGAVAFAVGSTSQKYFRKLSQGKTVSNSELHKWMKEGRQQGKAIAKKEADKKAKEYQC